LAGAAPCWIQAFFNKLCFGKTGYISMAAPSVGRRSCAGQREAAALISQSRRWFYGRVKRAAVRRLFFFAVARQLKQYCLFDFQ